MVMNRRSARHVLSTTALYLVLAGGAIFVLVPLAWAVSRPAEHHEIHDSQAVDARPAAWGNYLTVLTDPFGLYYQHAEDHRAEHSGTLSSASSPSPSRG
jgi:ABC-type glycerol-3-phosphate transport system permease component